MKSFPDIVAKALSVIFYPLFVPAYGVALFCYAHSVQVAPLAPAWVLIAVLGTLVLTCLLPVSAIGLMIRRGDVSDMQITNARERTIPFLYTVTGFGFWCYLMIAILQAPVYLAYIAVGATIAIALVAVINLRWKISAHLTGFGGLTGGIFSYCLGIGVMPAWSAILGLFALALAIMYARLHLDAHTPAQVCAGWLLGLVCTFIPYCIYTYVA